MENTDVVSYTGGKALEFFDDAAFNIRKSVAHILGKGSIKYSAPMLAHTLGLSFLGMDSYTVGTLMAVPAAAAFSSALVQGTYLHNKDMLRRQYAPEVAAKLGKKRENITEADLTLVASGDPEREIEGNDTLKEALVEEKKKRNWGVAISVVASMVSGLGVMALMGSGGVLHGLAAAGEASSALPLIGGLPLGGMAIAGTLGFAMYQTIATGMHWASEHVFGVEKQTVNDTIRQIHKQRARGHAVAQEQVFEAYLEAHPDLDKNIDASYGNRFHKLSDEERISVLEDIGRQIGLEKITADINTGRMRPEELAFAVHGQSSGVTHEEMAQTPTEHHRGIVSRVLVACKDGICKLLGLETTPAEPAEQQARPSAATTAQAPREYHASYRSPDGNNQLTVNAMEEEQPGRMTSFMKMVGQKRGKDGSVSFVEQVEQSRSGEITLG